jgi:ubiquinone/menaquinone biosynthesis C-methylase UbiE
MDKRFDPRKLEKLNNPERLKEIPPQFIWEKLDLRECKTIVDFGAGTGFFSKSFLNMMKEGTVYAADISEIMVKWMNENISGTNRGIIPIVMKESSIPLEKSIADLVLMINLHHELDHPLNSLKEAGRLLKPGGRICIIDWKKEDMPFGPPLEIRCSIDEISQQLNLAGFTNIQSDNSLIKHSVVWGSTIL